MGLGASAGLQSRLGPPAPPSRPSGTLAPATPACLRFCTLASLSCLQSFLRSLPSVCGALSRPSSPALPAPPWLSAVPPPCQSPCCAQTQEHLGAWIGAFVGICADPGAPGGAERSIRGHPPVAGRRAEDVIWVSGLAAVGAGARGRCHSLRSRGDLESASQSQQPSWGWPNPQPVFFSFEMEPPSPDSRATS